jgi:hypothetical protein
MASTDIKDFTDAWIDDPARKGLFTKGRDPKTGRPTGAIMDTRFYKEAAAQGLLTPWDGSHGKVDVNGTYYNQVNTNGDSVGNAGKKYDYFETGVKIGMAVTGGYIAYGVATGGAATETGLTATASPSVDGSLASTQYAGIGTLPVGGPSVAGTAAISGATAVGTRVGSTVAGMGVGDWIKLGLGIGGTALDVIGRLKAGEAAKEVNDFNAKVADAQAADALVRGQQDEARFRAGVRVLIGSQRAGFAGQNVDVTQGSPVHVQADAAFLGELDAQTIKNNAAREAWGYKIEAQNYRMGGDNAQSAARFGAAASAIGGGYSLLQARYGWGR